MIKELTVTDVMKRYGFQLKKEDLSLVVAPVSSGKTYYIFEELLKGANLSRVIYLCDTTALKQSVRLDEVYYEKCKYYDTTDIRKLGNQLAFHTDGMLIDERVTVLTYAQFGKLLEVKPDCIDNIDIIICDEAHNLVKYSDKYDNYARNEFTYIRVINRLKSEVGNKLIAFFTATPDSLFNTPKFDDINFCKYDLREVPGIRNLKEKNKCYFNHYRNLINKIAKYDGFKKGYKGVIYTDKISTIKEMEKLLREKGLSVCGIWSIHNEKWKMSDEALKVRDSIIKTGRIPDHIDILIINASYETGINIYDTRIELVAVNSTSSDTCTQSRGRVRKDIQVLYLLDPNAEDTEPIRLKKQWINRTLLKKDKEILAEELQLYDEKGRLKKWSSIQKALEDNGYTIINDSKRIDGKVTRYSMITSNT